MNCVKFDEGMKHFKKGSKEAKAYMAKLRSMRGKGKPRTITGGNALFAFLGQKYWELLKKWASEGFSERFAQKQEIERLRQLLKYKNDFSGGGLIDNEQDLKDFIDLIAGPWGWLKMYKRKSRQQEIEDLKRQIYGWKYNKKNIWGGKMKGKGSIGEKVYNTLNTDAFQQALSEQINLLQKK